MCKLHSDYVIVQTRTLWRRKGALLNTTLGPQIEIGEPLPIQAVWSSLTDLGHTASSIFQVPSPPSRRRVQLFLIQLSFNCIRTFSTQGRTQLSLRAMSVYGETSGCLVIWMLEHNEQCSSQSPADKPIGFHLGNLTASVN